MTEICKILALWQFRYILQAVVKCSLRETSKFVLNLFILNISLMRRPTSQSGLQKGPELRLNS